MDFILPWQSMLAIVSRTIETSSYSIVSPESESRLLRAFSIGGGDSIRFILSTSFKSISFSKQKKNYLKNQKNLF